MSTVKDTLIQPIVVQAQQDDAHQIQAAFDDMVTRNESNSIAGEPLEVPKAKRQQVDFQYHRLNWNFLRLMAQIADYAANKYGSVEQYADSRLIGEKSPLNHIPEHLRQYMAREPHDKFGDIKFHLAAVAYNAMMEYWYYEHGGPTVADTLYKRSEL